MTDDAMIETYSVAEAKRRFSELIDRVARGQRFLVERRGKPAVALVPPSQVSEGIGRSPGGLLSVVGLMADVEGFDETMREVVASRRKAKDRPAPEF